MSQSPLHKSQAIPLLRHAPTEAYEEFVQTWICTYPHAEPTRTRAWLLRCHTRLVEAYPDLRNWFAASLTERVGRLYQEDTNHPSGPSSYRARHYLTFLALRGYATFDWEWLIATHHLVIEPFLPVLGYPTTSLAWLKPLSTWAMSGRMPA